MANYNKSFNFTNGVQVDNDNFVVNSAGLVGIGTSIPGDFLDVYGSSTLRGDVTVSGLVTSTNLTVTGVSTFNDDIVGDTATNISGINAVTANYFYGNGTYMSGIVGFATAGWNIVTPEGGSANQGLTTLDLSKIGIGTTASYNKYDLVIGQDPIAANGISFAGNGGNINATGVVTATAGFVGVGSLLTLLDVDNVGYGTISNDYLPVLDNDRLPTTIDIGATGRFNSQSITGAGISISGIATAAGGFVGNITGNVTGNADTATTLTSSSSVNTSGIVTASGGFVGAAGSFGTSIGVGTATPVGDIHVRKATQAEIQVTSDDDTAIVAVGRSTALDGYNGQLRFGHTGGNFKYSDADSLDLINFGPGNFNFIGNSNLVSGASPKMTWGFGEASTPILALTGVGGSFGIGTTNPINRLQVVGVSTFETVYGTTLNITGASSVGVVTLTTGKVTASEFVSGNVTKVDGSIILDTGLTASGAVDSRIHANSYLTVGVSTFNAIEVAPAGSSGEGAIGIGATADPDTSYLNIGVGITQINISNNCYVGIGTTVPRVAMDFRATGFSTESRAIHLPQATTAHRDAYTGQLGPQQAGTLIYNSTTNKLNFWNGSAWQAVTSS